MGAGAVSGTSSRKPAFLIVGPVPSPDTERGASGLLAFAVCAVVAGLEGELKKAYQRVTSATKPSAPAAIIFLRSDFGFSSGKAITSTPSKPL
jgi:hypothetical protein